LKNFKAGSEEFDLGIVKNSQARLTQLENSTSINRIKSIISIYCSKQKYV